MHILIVEDEPLAAENLKKMLLEVAPEIQQISRTESIEQTVAFFADTTQHPDLVFMDIHLSDGSAFAIFDRITIETPIVFTTAYDKYALQAFKVNSIDYLLKPLDSGELAVAIGKFQKYNPQDIAGYIRQMYGLREMKHYPEKVLVTLNDELLPINVDDIAFFYATDGNTHIFSIDGKSYPYPKRLVYIMSTLDPLLFFRANKQFILSKKYVSKITVWLDNRLKISLLDGVKTPEDIYISKNKASEFRQWIAK